MPRAPTGLNTASRKQPDGTTVFRWYHRASGAFIGSSAEGWTKEAAAERVRELDRGDRAGPAAGSFGELAALYLGSPGFKRLAPKTQRDYRKHVDILRLAWADVPLAGISRKAVRALHQGFEDRPWQGNAIVRTLRLMLNYGIRQLEMPGLARGNPAAQVELHATQARTQIWSQPQIEAFLDAAPPAIRLAFALLLYTAQRPADMLRLSTPMMFERDGRTWIRLRQAKTGAGVDVPCHHRLLEEIGEAEAHKATKVAKLAASPLLVAAPRGGDWTYRNFARAWDVTRAKANGRLARAAIGAMGGLPRPRDAKRREAAKAKVRTVMLHGVQRRDLRRTGVVQLALVGATVPQIAALTGWKIDHAQHIVDTYLPRHGNVALGGMERWEAGEAKVVTLGPRRKTASGP